ncbi:MAG: hypothetical protein PHT19_07170, partial [Methylococcus sp.]|nr:hypothetical protein [Methylococcus sp.]
RGKSSCGGMYSCGTVYALATNGSGYNVLHNFDGTTGADPQAGLLQGADGRLYGTTSRGGSFNYVYGTVYALAADGSGYTVLHSFDNANGSSPQAGLILGADGRMYGTTSQGSSSNLGTVYALAADGSGYTVLQNFDGANGANPQAGLLQDLDGYLYGTAPNGGPQGGGTLFRLAPPAPTATPNPTTTPAPTTTPSPTATPTPTATPAPVHPVKLKVTKAGQGTVSSLPGGIECGEACSAPFEIDSAVTLTAVPEPGFGFARWSGACQGEVPSCTVELNKAKTVTAKFERTLAELTVKKTGQGEGRVTSTPAGIDCGAECDALFEAGAEVAVTAVPEEGYEFRGWGGACGGKKPTCTIALKKAKAKKLTAKFLRKRN